MKHLLIIALLCCTIGTVSAHCSVHRHTHRRAAAAAATDSSASYVGTNDFYLALVREGVRKA